MRSASGMSVMLGTWRRYSWRAVRRPAKPRSQPSIMASENAHSAEVPQAAATSARHGSRAATAGPHSTAAAPISTAPREPQPTWGSHHPKIGAVCAKSRIRWGVLLISGVMVPRSRCGTTKAATSTITPMVNAASSRRPMRMAPHYGRPRWDPVPNKLDTCP
ncbi:hypothetical protein BN1047_04974 [Mycolicibacterium neoaurum]|uniref:Uncharacterized protein n=1 Tax=Mycolicibacterium neoaurum TaxID=1795 RepID=A0AAV2WT90_MYCNE|nr:hypothetical protein BN1047_04974 [Mycolicibacterium neoaurum]